MTQLYYLVTLRRHQVKDYVDYEHLDNIINGLDKQFFDIKDYCLERHGKYKQLHAHLIVKVNKGFRYKRHVKAVKGYIMHFKAITTSLRNVSAYIHKHCKNHSHEQLEQTRYCNYYSHHYGF